MLYQALRLFLNFQLQLYAETLKSILNFSIHFNILQWVFLVIVVEVFA